MLAKSAWGPGPWQSEPDREEFRAHGFPCVLRRGGGGTWCGYVGVPPGHPWHGVNEANMEDRPSVHGGVTYTEPCAHDIGVCHVPEAGEPEDLWWVGFDCSHFRDLRPADQAILQRSSAWESLSELFRTQDVYRTIEYAREETTSLARQAAEAQ